MATYTIKSGHKLTVVTDVYTSGKYFRVADVANTKTAPTSVEVSTTVVLGPFTNDQTYDFHFDGTGVTYTDAFTDLSVLNGFVGGQASFVAAITNAATGTQIATAVNGIKAALVSAGLMAAS